MIRHITLALLALSPVVSIAADFKIGDKIFLKPDAEITVDGKPVDVATILMPAKIVEITDGGHGQRGHSIFHALIPWSAIIWSAPIPSIWEYAFGTVNPDTGDNADTASSKG